MIDLNDAGAENVEIPKRLEKVAYICDRKQCKECWKVCGHTTDIRHAKNIPADADLEETILNLKFEEVSPGYFMEIEKEKTND